MISKIELGKIYVREYYEDTKWGAIPKLMYVVPIEVKKINSEDSIVFYYELEHPEHIVKEYDDIVLECWRKA